MGSEFIIGGGGISGVPVIGCSSEQESVYLLVGILKDFFTLSNQCICFDQARGQCMVVFVEALQLFGC